METTFWIGLVLFLFAWPIAGWLLFRFLEARVIVISLAVATALFTVTFLIVRPSYEQFVSRLGVFMVDGRVPGDATFSNSAALLLILWVNLIGLLLMGWSAYALLIDLHHSLFGSREAAS